MELRTDRIKVEMSDSEACDIAYHIKHSLKESILSHYICLQQCSGVENAKGLFEKQCRKDLEMMKSLMMMSSGRSGEWMEKELWRFLEEEYTKRRESASKS